jgi:D-alanine-D-alanine ligase-like ATP-grasp enzyme
VLASAVGMDKAYAKVVLRDAGLPVMPSLTLTAREWYRDPDGVRHRIADLGFPLFVKPAPARRPAAYACPRVSSHWVSCSRRAARSR